MHQIINTKKAPAPIGPYNQSVRTGNLLFVSGQVPFIAETMELITESVEAETHQVMKNIQMILNEAGLDFKHIVKASIFCKDLNDFTRINEVYGSYFEDNYPARECVEVARLPKDVRVEISVIAAF
ncbi:MAG: reactive intermediate/imine deaminase [Flavobacteriales bacterium]|nr:reactive intermediate/imine deaminase [Flavobacteriales bacterium]|tara:strand:+ start:7660 stop:8037 length:378 start_codon:yes stop_codon:yes gene_type:complete